MRGEAGQILLNRSFGRLRVDAGVSVLPFGKRRLTSEAVPTGRTRAKCEGEVMAFFREAVHVCGLVVACLCAIAALTIAVAIVANKLSDPQAWKAVLFFAAIGCASWIAARAARTRDE